MKKSAFPLIICFLLFYFFAEGKSGLWAGREDFFRASKRDSIESMRPPGRIRETLHPERAKGNPAPYVGSIPFESSVSGTGARIYTVPIVTTEGLKLTPGVYLQYNSQGGCGACGYGWDIAGVSKITRIHKNLYYHDMIAPASNALNAVGAVFALDGVPMVTNTSPLSSSFPLVTAFGNIIVAPIYSGQNLSGFTVLYPDGRRGEYGIFAGPTATVNENIYPVTSMEDIDGNRIEYEYLPKGASTGDQFLISKIRYGIRGAQSALAEIEFIYSASQYYNTVYYAGAGMDNRSLLWSVCSRSSGNTLCQYFMSYEQDGNDSLLSRIDCFGHSPMYKLNPLRFSYFADEQGSVTPVITQSIMGYMSSYWSTDDLCVMRGKFFSEDYNDGIVVYPKHNTYRSFYIGGQYVFGSDYSPDQEMNIIPIVGEVYSSPDTLHCGRNFQGLWAADVNGDGRDELIKCNYAGTEGNSNTLLRISTYSVGHYSGSHALLNTSTVSVDGLVNSGVLSSPLWRAFLIGDFVGTGKSQLMTVSFNTTPLNASHTSYCDLIDLDTGTKVSGFTSPFSLSASGSMPVAVDLEGDGRTEIVRNDSGYLKVYRLNAYNLLTLSGSYAFPATVTDSLFKKANYTDLNGDGILDIAIRISGQSWVFCVGTGTGFIMQTSTCGGSGTDSEFMFMDMDKDHLTDLVEITSSNVMKVYGNEGGFTIATTAESEYSGLSSSKNIIPANITHYGNISAFIKIDSCYIKQFGYTINKSARRLLTGMVDGYGKKQWNGYDCLAEWNNSGCYSVDPNTVCPSGYRLWSGNIYLLAEETTYLSEAVQDTMVTCHMYLYHDAVMHTGGLGFIGFNRTEDWDAMSGDDVFIWHDTQLLGVPVKRNKYNLYLVEKDSLTYDANVDPYKKMNPLLTATYHTDMLTGVQTRQEYEYGDYDYPSVSRSYWYRNNLLDGYELKRYQYLHQTSDASCYILGGMTNIRSWQDVAMDDTYYARKTLVSYDAKMHPVEISEYVGMPLFTKDPATLLSHRILAYNSYGDLLSDKSAAYGATSHRGNTYTYDAYGREVSVTNPLGQTTSVVSYNAFGKVLSTTDHKSRQTTWTYDPFGRSSLCSHPDGTVEHWSSAWGGSGAYYTSYTKTGAPEQITEYDAACRVVRKTVQDIDSTYVSIDRLYDECGRLYKVSLPFRQPDTTRIWNTYSYDIYNRPTLYQEASGKTSSWSYAGLSTTETRDGVSRTITKDAMGHVLSVADPGGTIMYTLLDDGQPSQISTPGNPGHRAVRTFNYDIYRRRTSLVDPSTGTRTTSYTQYSDGRIEEEYTGPNGTYIVMYDTLGRRSSISEPPFTLFPAVSYQYNADGLLSSVTSLNGASETYTYDAYDRVSGITQSSGNGVILTKEYTYGAGSKVASVKYSEQGLGEICTENYTYACGYHKKTALSDGTTVYELISRNVYGHPTAVQTGSLSRTYSYNSYGIPTGRQAGTALEESYTFNANTGNLTQWTNILAGTYTDYGYDSLNRLSSVNQGLYTYNVYGSRSAGASDNPSAPIDNYLNLNDPYLLTDLRITPRVWDSFPYQTITYNGRDRPTSVSQNGYLAQIGYDGEGDRVSMTVSRNDTTLVSKTYLGGQYEKEVKDTSTIRRLYLGGDYYSAPAVLVKEGNGNWIFYNIIRDYLGSIRSVAAAAGTPLYTYSYGAWGETPSGPDLFLGRGYAGHEYLPWFNLYNMNARLYDTSVGRFLSPDPYIQMPDFTQNYNRYAYALNNPLKYTDESGEFVLTTAIIVGVALGVTIGALTGVAIAEDKGVTGWSYAGYVFGGALIGGIGGLASGWIGGVVSSSLAIGGFWGGAISGGISGAVGGGINGFGLTLMSTGSLSQAWNGGVTGLVYGAGAGAVLGGVWGGIDAWSHGGNFWTGEMPQTLSEPEVVPDTTPQVRKNAAKGRIGEQRALEMLEEQGFTEPRSQMSIVSEGTPVRTDFVVEYNGKPVIVEVKTGATAQFTHNQNIVYPKMAEGLPIPTARAGDNIASLLSAQNPVHTTSFTYTGQKPVPFLTKYGTYNQYYFLVIRFNF